MQQYAPAADEILIREQDAGVVTLRLNRPRQLNALSEAMLDALQRELAALGADASLRCVVIAGLKAKNAFVEAITDCGNESSYGIFKLMHCVRALHLPNAAI